VAGRGEMLSGCEKREKTLRSSRREKGTGKEGGGGGKLAENRTEKEGRGDARRKMTSFPRRMEKFFSKRKPSTRSE